jgi:two-component system, NtrC family, response regulator AtoC
MASEPLSSRRVLIANRDQAEQRHLSSVVTSLGLEPVVAGSGHEPLATLSQHGFLLSFIDLDAMGTAQLRRLKAEGGDPGHVIIIADADGPTRVPEPDVLGSHDVLKRPLTPERLKQAIKTAIARPAHTAGAETQDDGSRRLGDELSLWTSSLMLEIREIIRQAARADITVLICGETGTGKDLVARAIHQFGVRKSGPFIKVNCAAVPRELLESELFGHERGAFTGAHQLKIGKFESADHGTIFLDEIGDLHPALQGKLLHVLQDGQFSRVGGRSTIKVDVRVLAATNQNLEQAVAAGRFRDDLYYRLNVVQIAVPALRERSEEIPLLAQYFVDRYAKLLQHESFTLPAETLHRLMRYRYPGNVRELENIIKRMIVLGDSHLARAPWPGEATNGKSDGDFRPSPVQARISLKDISRKAALAAERQAILEALEQTHWNRIRAAKLLGVSYRALLYKIKDAALAQDERSSNLR